MPRAHAGAYTVNGIAYPSQYSYRKALAAERGMSVVAYRATRSAERFLDKLGVRGSRAYDRTLEALSLMRKGASATRAAKRAGATTKSIAKYGRGAVERHGRRLVARDSDTMPRRMQVLMPDGIERNVIIRNSREASLLANHANALRRYLNTGDATELEKFQGKAVTINGKKVPLVADTATIDKLTRAGVIDEYEPYERSLA